ncbi:MAG TPA: LuxR C-terminal-related transcriptional regulator [Bacteroidales bacterium]|nr:LuxR C-terminal-related transcriptional regulator [Bacteroidales bacterium]
MAATIDMKSITVDTKMVDLLRSNLNLLFVLNQFSIPLGFGEKTIREVCLKHSVDSQSFLTLLQFHGNPESPDLDRLSNLKPEVILGYLRKSHHYFVGYRLPAIKEKFAAALPEGGTRATILSYFEEYESEVREHMDYENTVFYPYVQKLIDHSDKPTYSVSEYEARHNNIEEKLDDLINLIIKYLPTEGNPLMLADVLEDLRQCNSDLNIHTFLEDEVLVPKIRKMEKKPESDAVKISVEQEELSAREKDIVRSVAKGLSNKEIADEHFISIHTVITHRRNISRKLAIHSSAGLTVYAILNKLVDIEDLRH